MLVECECPIFAPQPDELASRAGEYSVRALMAVAVILLAYHGARLAKVVLRCVSCCCPAAAAREANEGEGGAPAQDEEERRKMECAVDLAMEARRLERVRAAVNVMANVFPAFLLMQTAFHSGYLWGEISPAQARNMWREVYPPLVYGTIVSTTWNAAPWLVTPRQVDIAHILVYIFWLLGGTVYKDNEYEFVYAATWITCTRTICAVIFGNSNLVTILSGALSVANMVFLYLSFDGELFFYHAVRELWAFATIVILCKLVESSLLAEVKSSVEARFSSQEETTVHSLLSAMCDAVVHLGQDLCIQRPAPRLALLLLMPNTVRHLRGSRIADYMAEDDRERFDQVAMDRETITRSLNVHLRDQYGSLVGVRIFLARYKTNEDGQNCQLVGVSVDEEAGINHVPDLHDAMAVPARLQHVPSQRTNSVAERSQQSCNSAQSDESLPLQSAAEDEVAVWLDPDDAMLTVLSCTAGFTVVCGPASSGSFSLLKAIADRDAFMHWFQHSYNAKLHHDVYEQELDGDEEPMEPLDLLLLPQRACQKAIGLRATCSMSLVFEQEEHLVMKLNFHNVSEVSRPKKSRDRERRRRRVRDATASDLPRMNRTSPTASASSIAL